MEQEDGDDSLGLDFFFSIYYFFFLNAVAVALLGWSMYH